MIKHSSMKPSLIARRSRRPQAASLKPSIFRPHSPETTFAATKTLEQRRQFGQFFTPKPIALMMADWVCSSHPRTILDPAVGPGAFPRAVIERLSSSWRMTCVDIDPLVIRFLDEGQHALPRCLEIESRLGDFLTMRFDEKFDGIIANPPYLRHHAMSYNFDIFSFVGSLVNLNLSRLTNSYILFLLRCVALLKQGGRMSFLIPAEWANANFGQPIKEFLLDKGLLQRMAYFSHTSDVFEDALTTSCVLFVENKSSLVPSPLPVHYVPKDISLDSLDSMEALESSFPATEIPRPTLRASKKWDALVRGGATLPLPGFIPLGDIATTKRGIATGANDFFHITKSEADAAGISDQNLFPCVGRAGDVAGLVFTKMDYERLAQTNACTQLVAFGRETTNREQLYIQRGEAQGLPSRYLLTMRSPWYKMEERPPAPIWSAVFNRERLRFVYNQARVHNLTTFHGIFPRTLTEEQTVGLVALLNSPIVQSLAAEQVRVYGGGLRKFEPRDLLSILVPDIRAVPFSTLFALAEALCQVSEPAIEEAAKTAALARLDELAAETASAASLKPRTLF